MTLYIARRLLWTIVVVFCVIAITFAIFYLLPAGDPALSFAGHSPTAQEIHELHIRLGLDKPWYEQFFGAQPSFLPNDTEAVWEVAEHRYIYIVQQPERAGNALVLSFVDDIDAGLPGSPGGASSPPGARHTTAG